MDIPYTHLYSFFHLSTNRVEVQNRISRLELILLELEFNTNIQDENLIVKTLKYICFSIDGPLIYLNTSQFSQPRLLITFYVLHLLLYLHEYFFSFSFLILWVFIYLITKLL